MSAFHNVCQHRGARLVDGTGNCRTGRFRCPWHGFVYDLQGAVGAVPLRESFDPVELEGLRAPAVRVVEWGGWIWMMLSDDELLLSCYHEDAVDDHGMFVGDREEFADWVVGMHSATHLSHQHCLFNHTCDLDGDVAHAETYYMFAGMNREGTALVTSGGR